MISGRKGEEKRISAANGIHRLQFGMSKVQARL